MTQVRVHRHADGRVEIETDLDGAAIERILTRVFSDPTVLASLAALPERRSPTRAQTARLRGPALSDEEVSKLRERVPSTPQVAEFIRSKPNRAHSMREVSEQFLGLRVRGNSPSRAEKQLFYMMQDRLSGARRMIEREDKSGKFVSDGIRKIGHSRVYTWKYV